LTRPFPGMDPYLEERSGWRGFHARMLNYISADLQPKLLPRYYAAFEESVRLGPLDELVVPDGHVRREAPRDPTALALLERPSLEGATPVERIDVPDLEMPHRYLEIRDIRHRQVVTVIELLSPWNKTGTGHEDYRAKQREYLLSDANLVEIDLLRGGRHAIAVPAGRVGPSDYRVCVHRARTSRFEVIRFGIRDSLPRIAIPLGPEDADVLLDLDSAFGQSYQAGAYWSVIDYDVSPDPPLGDEDSLWAQQRVAEWREGSAEV
jgi:hypothetical protein